MKKQNKYIEILKTILETIVKIRRFEKKKYKLMIIIIMFYDLFYKIIHRLVQNELRV